MKNIYCDMDGVLVGFVGGAINKINEALLAPPAGFEELADNVVNTLGRNYVIADDLKKYSPTSVAAATDFMYALLEDDEDFWANLPWQEGGRELWNHIKPYKPTILTSPMDKRGKKGSLRGKERWIKENLGLANIKGVIFEHKKFKYATCENGEPNVLIDDFLTKIEPWKDNGGIGIHHKGDAAETINALEEN